MQNIERQDSYIVLGDIAGYISGALIYYRNKLLYLHEKGWNSIMLPLKRGKVYVRDADRFAVGCFPFLTQHPAEFSIRQREQLLEVLANAVGEISGNCIIETGTDWTAYWGELLAKKLKAKHIILFLDEDNKRIENSLAFFNFKHLRKELACITPQTTINMFNGFKFVEPSEAYSFWAWCTNSVQEYDSELSDMIKQKDFNIGSIGRLEKVYVPQIIDGVESFARKNPATRILLVFFGGSAGMEKVKIQQAIHRIPNVELLISDFMWPFPKSALDKMDIFISGAGGVIISDQLGIPTVAMDVRGAGAISLSSDAEYKLNPLYRRDGSNFSAKVSDYLDAAFRNNMQRNTCTLDIDRQWESFCIDFEQQIDEANKLENDLIYFDTSTLPLDSKGLLRQLLTHLFGIEAVGRVKSLVHKIEKTSTDLYPWI